MPSAQTCLHIGCSRHNPVVDMRHLARSALGRCDGEASSPMRDWPSCRGAAGRRRADPTVDPLVALALAKLLEVPSSKGVDASAEMRHADMSPMNSHQDRCLVIGVDVSNPMDAYPGLFLLADARYPSHTRSAIHGVIASTGPRGCHAGSSTTGALFDVFVSDAVSPVQSPSDGHHSRCAHAHTTLSSSVALGTASDDLFVRSGGGLTIKGPSREDENIFVADALIASLAVGLPLLNPTGGAAVVRLSGGEAPADQGGRIGAAIRTLRHRFAHVELFKDEFGMIAFGFGTGCRAEHVLSCPHNIREDFPGFSRSGGKSSSSKPPRQWDHYHNPMDSRKKFFMALHPSFDKAPPPETLLGHLQREREAAERRDEADEAFMEMVSESLDTFDDKS